MSTLCEHNSNGSEIATTTRRATRSISSANSISGKNIVNSSPASRASSGRRARASGEFGVDDHAQAIGDHDQQLVATRMAEAVVDRLEPVEIDEQHRRSGRAVRFAQQLVGLRAEMEPVGKRGDGIVHAERMRILDRRAHFGEEAIHRRRDLRHRPRGRSAGAGETRSPSSTASRRSPSAESARALSLFGRSDAM